MKDKKIKISQASSVKVNKKWIITIVLWTFLLSMFMSAASTAALEGLNLALLFLVLILFVFIGIIFDIIGIAVTTADERPFHSLATRRIRSAVKSIELIRKANKVATFCNDVIGDICGIVSGGIGAVLVTKIISICPKINMLFASLIITGIISALTVGGKAVGKCFALYKNNEIVFTVGKILCVFERKKTEGYKR